MTREEKQKAIDALKISAPVMAVTQEEFNNYIQTLNQVMDWLEQEPCEDTISRQAVNILVDELARAISDERCCISRGRSTATIMQDILDLPSVNPQEKTGHWIEEEINEWSRKTYCSKCGESALLEYVHVGDIYYGSAKGVIKKTNYCPHCGAKMVEPQESEE